ncbi:hypothetical protein ACVIGB_008624 [Bradyrhizobium sp. USDA 4341]
MRTRYHKQKLGGSTNLYSSKASRTHWTAALTCRFCRRNRPKQRILVDVVQ